jgi:hypothetical protein
MKTATIGVVAWLFAVTTASAEVQLTMQNGRVSLVAKDATVRQILTEWARVGDTKIVNIERVPGGPVTLELTNVPEAQALDVVLRSLSGYIAAPRPVEAANLSRFDRIILMPTLAAARPPTPASPAPVFQQQNPQFPPAQPVADDDDDRPVPNVPVPARGPVFNQFPQPQVGNPQQQQQPVPVMPGQMPNIPNGPNTIPNPPNQNPAPTASPTPVAPYGGVAVPGMVAPPPPAAPGQVPGQPPVRRPGGPGGQ